MKEKLLDGLNKFLMFDLFFVLFAFAWFAIALLGRAAGLPLGWNVWYALWDPVFMPAIGILMAGAILTGIFGQISKRLNSN
ncbi:hypothetical protein [Lusitaniella coriacea]|uniref:hypothetical protein n=1 Tax=Lusitaniella coriacea TaxID=1983105 RepID=UPI003CFA6AFC